MLEWREILASVIPALIWIGGVASTLITAYIIQRWTYRADRRGAREERLLSYYCELVGIAAAELDRAKMSDTTVMFLKRAGENPDSNEWKQWKKLEERRHEYRRDMARVAFQIRLLEANTELVDALQELLQKQVFFYPDDEQYGDVRQQRELRTKKLAEFEQALEKLCNAILSHYGRLRRARRQHGTVASD